MQNLICSGEKIQVTVPAAGLSSGQPYLLGSRLVIMETGSVNPGDLCVAVTRGVYSVPVATGTAIAQGAKVYWDNAAQNITSVAANNTYAGYAYAAVAATDTTMQLLLSEG
jgi:predicted RecA/RadA family phage recombinase